ncbi:ParB N-terminal domain-containing protein [Pelagibius litoralis]|uniref:ParB N-terminal domain-containing protein n=1 Tax=Pelagibius litoralis TaxID=374515 RepID=A0A967C7A9_9PROT|nr:ParB N-terminal domain-containing protein [Pelagibius litoralis]NIA67902.1 ParB N-terminal domain-containing protein [Pelagibius litoralis]
MKTKIECLNVSHIQVIGERRPIDEAAVKVLVKSIEDLGLKTPPSVRYVDEMEIDGEHYVKVPVLVAGAHRLEAARRLGWGYIECLVQDGDDPLEAALWEVDENLARQDLTTDQKREHLKRRKELWEQQQAETGGTPCPTSLADGRRAAPQHQKGFAADTAEKTGMSKRQVNRLLAEPKPRPAPPPKTQAPDKSDAAEASPPVGPDDGYDKWADEMKAAWADAPPDAQQWFRDQIATHGIDHDFDPPQQGGAGVSQPFRIVLGFAGFCSANDPGKYAKHIPVDERNDVGELYASVKDWLETFIDALDAEGEDQ